MKKSLKLNAFLNVIKSCMGLIFPLITFPYSSRVIGPVGIGKVNFANSIISYFTIIASLGIFTYAIKEAAKVRDSKDELSKFSKEIFTINSISTLVAYFLFFISLCLVPKFHDYKILLCICSSTILFTTLGLSWLYTALEEYVYITLRSIFFQILSIVSLFIFVHKPDDYIIYGSINVLASVGSNVLNFIHSRKYISWKTKYKLELKKHLKPIFTLFAMSVATRIYTVLDTTLLGFISGDKAVGYYSAASKLNHIVLNIVTSIGAVMLPRLAYLIGKNKAKDFSDLAYKGIEVLFLISIPCSIGLTLVSKAVILILSGEQYLQTLPTMQVLNPIIVIIGLSNFIGVQIFMPLNKEKWTLYSVITGAFVNLFTSILLIYKFNELGAAIGTLIAELSVTTVQIILVRKYLKISRIFKLFIKYLLNSLLMAIPVYYFSNKITNLYVSFSISVISGIVLYFILLLLEKNYLLFDTIIKLKGKFHR